MTSSSTVRLSVSKADRPPSLGPPFFRQPKKLKERLEDSENMQPVTDKNVCYSF